MTEHPMPGPRILIVEDEAITVAALKRELTALGHHVIGTADTAEAAVAIADREKPDLVLMDITLSGKLDGIAAAVAIRGHVGAPVVFLTAHADAGTIERAMLAGPFGYLLKPFTGAELSAAIQVALSQSRKEIDRRSKPEA
jgi:DNA-binding response OmpR family regulator